MDAFAGFLLLVFAGSALGILSVFALYPLALVTVAAFARRREAAPTAQPKSASLLVALRNAEGMAAAKVRNSLELEFPGALQLVFVSDGSSDATVERLRAAGGERIEVLEFREHRGKAEALNVGAARCHGEMLVLSDADALLAPDALLALARRFTDPEVGGVGGQRVLGEANGELKHAQQRYVAADSALKRAESLLGSVTANDGKLYAVRRELFRPIAPGATDDLYTSMSVIEQGRRFVFEPRARAFVRTPSRSAGHEIARRRRIVARSLHGIARKRALLNPARHGAFAFQLLVNKVLRRMLPLFLIGLFASSLALAATRPWAMYVLLAQLAFYALAALHPWCARSGLRALAGPASVARYFCAGNLGTLLGLLDFVRGRETIKWEPVKADR